uniref:Cytochrome b5 heme-binding domain-containing protein n=1 Tax=Trichuris muris TaxID=70415 RepID=A0A5S6QZ86_TRIMR
MNRWREHVRSLTDPSGTGGRILKVTAKDLREHSTADNLWILLDGRVYNVTHYLPFHPGGRDALLSAIGQDGAPAYQYHPWVNCHSVLERCLVGYFVDQRSVDERGSAKKAS